MVLLSSDFRIMDIGVLSSYRGCSDVITWVEIEYRIERTDTDSLDCGHLICYCGKLAVDVFDENTFDPSNFISKDSLNTLMVKQWVESKIPQFKKDEWEQFADNYFNERIASIEEGKLSAVVDGPWIQINN